MEVMRHASILPAIKCSTCSEEIEISSMGDHICPQTEAKKQTIVYRIEETLVQPIASNIAQPQQSNVSLDQDIVTSKDELKEATNGRTHTIQHGFRSWSRPSRPALPHIDAVAANKIYVQPEVISPLSHTSSNPRSPVSPCLSGSSIRSPVQRSLTSPLPRMYRPPSPELSSNLDCAFPPFPVSRPSTASSQRSIRSASAKVRGAGSVRTASSSPHAGVTSAQGLKSPRTPVASEAAIGSPPTGFDFGQISSGSITSTAALDPSAHDVDWPCKNISDEKDTTTLVDGLESQSVVASTDRSPTIQSPTVKYGSLLPSTVQGFRFVPQRPVRPEPLDGFLASLKSEVESPKELPGVTLRLETRSNTFPLAGQPSIVQSRKHNFSLRRPSEAIARTLRKRSPPTIQADLPSPVPMERNLESPTNAGTHEQSHSVRVPSNSSSTSSSTTRCSDRSSIISDISLPASAASSVLLLSEPFEQLPIGHMSPHSKLDLEDVAKDFLRGASNDDERDYFQQSATTGLGLGLEESPTVPGLGVFQPFISCQPSASTTPEPHQLDFPESTKDVSLADSPVEKRSSKRPGTNSKHHCRGCNEPIMGKSVKAADGRLTGRYHKQCFVCKTCHSPFATADFYVIDNNPYCEQHYHKLNNSLCISCDQGIEGPYLETQNGLKFHTNCFACSDCQQILNNDYFEVGGKSYCEQHAMTAHRLQAGLGPSKDMERRTTRYMVM